MLVHDIKDNDALQRFLGLLMGQKDDWKTNPTFMLYTWKDYSYVLSYCMKVQYRVCKPRFEDKSIENHFLQKNKETNITSFRWPVLAGAEDVVVDDGILIPRHPLMATIFVELGVCSFNAHCDTMQRMDYIIEQVMACRA